MTNAYSAHTIVQTVFDSTEDAIRVVQAAPISASIDISQLDVFIVGVDDDVTFDVNLVSAESSVELGTTFPDPINCNIESIESSVDIDVNILTDPVNVNISATGVTQPVSGTVSVGNTVDVDIESSIELDVNVTNSELNVNVSNEDLLVKAAHPVLTYGQVVVGIDRTMIVEAAARKHGVMLRNQGNRDCWIGFDSGLDPDGSADAGFLLRPLDVAAFPTSGDVFGITEDSYTTTVAWVEI